jgi:putative flippase GtrA
MEKQMSDKKSKDSVLRRLYARYSEIINYLIFGVITTVVAMGVYFLIIYIGKRHMSDTDPMFYYVRLTAQIFNWISGVLVAFFTNRKWVFKGYEKGVKAAWHQFLGFCVSRLGTLGLDTAVTFGLVLLLLNKGYESWKVPLVGWEISADFIAKLVASVIVVIVNYIISKLLIFKSQPTEAADDNTDNVKEEK